MAGPVTEVILVVGAVLAAILVLMVWRAILGWQRDRLRARAPGHLLDRDDGPSSDRASGFRRGRRDDWDVATYGAMPGYMNVGTSEASASGHDVGGAAHEERFHTFDSFEGGESGGAGGGASWGSDGDGGTSDSGNSGGGDSGGDGGGGGGGGDGGGGGGD